MYVEIVTSFYCTNYKERLDELIKALDNNLSHKYINNIHLFVDDSKCIDFLKDRYKLIFENKIKICGIGKQPLYSDLFSYCNNLKGKICMITNSDIWLYNITNINCLNKLKSQSTSTCFSLTRHEHDFNTTSINNYVGSHDAFLFIAPINNQIIKHVRHKQNVWGSENVVLYELNKLGYIIYNPCKEIIIIHEHKSGFRKTVERINNGDYDGDNKYKIRSFIVKPDHHKKSPIQYRYRSTSSYKFFNFAIFRN